MGTFGAELRLERELRAISLEEISSATKISTRFLRALEEEQFNQLPGGVYNKGFVRAYARYLGIDEEKAVASYMAAVGALEPKEDLAVIAEQVEAARRRSMAVRSGRMKSLLPTLAAVVVVAIVVAIAVGRWWPKRTSVRAPLEQVHAAAPPSARKANQPPARVAGSNLSAPLGSPQEVIPAQYQPASAAAETDTTPASNPAGAKSEWPIQLELRALSRAWVSVRVDGKDAGEFMLDAARNGQTSRSIHGQDSVVLTVGDPAGLEVTYNGVRLPALGPKGLRSQAVFTPLGMQEN